MTTKNQCCKDCRYRDTRTAIGEICDNSNCKCHQSDSVVEEFTPLAMEMKQFLKDQDVEALHLDSVAGRLAVLIRRKLTTLKQTAEAHEQEMYEALDAEYQLQIKHAVDAERKTAQQEKEELIADMRKKVSKLRTVDRLDNNGMETIIRRQVLDLLDQLTTK